MNTSASFRLPELLAPAGNLEKMRSAVHYGADAVYLGGKQYSLRAQAANFTDQELAEAVEYARRHAVKVYVTVNIFARNQDLAGLAERLPKLRDLGVDALIVADPGVIRMARAVIPDMPLHLSTQANVTNSENALFWRDQGLRRLNLARELSLDEICSIRRISTCELEVFVHGAICIAYSGRCMLSAYLTGRDANQGDCAQPCRYGYTLMEQKRPGQYFPVEEDQRGLYIFNAHDLCLLRQLPALVAAGVDALKIEGRMKSTGYVSAVVRLYRLALDWIAAQHRKGLELATLTLPEAFEQEVVKIGARGQSEHFFTAPPSADDMMYGQMREQQRYAPVGIVIAMDPLFVETRYMLEFGDVIELLGASIAPFSCRVIGLFDEQGQALERANPGMKITLHTEPPLIDARPLDLLRKVLPLP